MRLKYYLRGLGLGIVVTAIIMGVAASKNRRMTDEEIIARAKQLGMIEDTVLTEGVDREDNDERQQPEDTGNETENQTDAGQSGQDEATVQPQPEESEPNIQANANVSEPDTQADADALETGDAESGTHMGLDDSETDLPENASAISGVIIIKSGEGSYTVSKKLAEIGAVESAADFDTYLCENGYDKKIRAGTYTIPADASDEQMAKIVTGAKITE